MSDKSPESIIELRSVTKRFDGRTVINAVTLPILRGETMVIMGSSGCGKSTTLRMMIGDYHPDEGEVRIFGKSWATMSETEANDVRLRFGILFQSGALLNSMTVGENIALPMREHTDLDEQVIRIMVKMKLELVGLRDFEHLMPAQLSGGMKKRVGLARAIALDPEILFYDEPTAGLDPIATAVTDELIRDLSKKLGVTSVVVTHDMGSAFRIADRMAVLYRGDLIALGAPDTIRNSGDARVKQFIEGLADGPIPLRQSSKDYAADLLGQV
ncbi:MAG TPA: ABC transporter ATP-binding protein [Phycisphaerae bacterium]|nr:ABC transporter ATP-binding protein [Phycisphaerae bacterium]